jgi:hypothetical protein
VSTARAPDCPNGHPISKGISIGLGLGSESGSVGEDDGVGDGDAVGESSGDVDRAGLSDWKGDESAATDGSGVIDAGVAAVIVAVGSADDSGSELQATTASAVQQMEPNRRITPPMTNRARDVRRD